MRSLLFVPLGILVSAAVWAGQEYPAQPGDQVKTGELIVRLKAGAPSSVILSYLPGAQVKPLSHLNLFHVTAPVLPANVAALLAADGLVDFVEPNRIRHANVGLPNDPDFSQQWPLVNLGAVQAWTVVPNQFLTAATAGTGRIEVAELDTGIDCTHPDFMNLGASSTNSALGGQLLWSASQALVATTLPSPACPWQDDYGHGTHVAGIIAAAANNGIGVAGLAYPVQVVAYKVLDNTASGTDVTVADAIMSAADAGIPIISLSLGAPGYSQTIQLAVNYAWQRNALVIAAAGNDSSSEIFYPAGANYAVGVSATDSNSNFASFSNFGNGVELAGPGVSVLSTEPAYFVPISSSSGYGSLSGTSMATPHVSAVAGLIATASPGTSAAAILLRLEQTASSTTAGGGWNQDFGYGIVNAYDAVSGTLRAAANGGVTGQVTDSNANPIANATVTISGSSVTTDSTGLFRFGTFSAGTYGVQISASGFTTQNLTVTVPPGADATLTVMMGVSYGSFTGMVTDDGAAVPNAVVQAISANLIQGTTTTDITGQYTLWAPAGAYSLLVTNIGEANSTVAGQTVAGGGTTTANITIARFGSISGTVTNPSGAPVSGATVSITGGIFPVTGTTGANGQFLVSGLAAGSYAVTCSNFSYSGSAVTGLVVSPENVTIGNCQLGAISLTPWSNFKVLTIDHTKVAATLTNFPVLVSLASDANLAATAQASGNDILFTASDGETKLAHEIETYNSSTGQLIAWVQAPSVSSTADTVIYMYYGNASATNQQNATAVWDSNYQAVWHLANGTTLSAMDSTSNNNNGTLVNSPAATTGQIDGGASFNGANSTITTEVVAGSGNFTLSAWANSNDNTTYYTMLVGDSNYSRLIAFGGGTLYFAGGNTPAPPTGSWHYYVLTQSAGSSQTLYIDGSPVVTGASNSFGSLVLGSLANALDYYNGSADEVRFSSSIRASGWIATEYSNQNSPGAFLSVGAQQSNVGGAVSIMVTSAPAGLAVTVDEASCPVTPCTYQWTPGSMHTLAAATQAGSAGTQYAFASWTGSAGSPDQVTAPSTPATYTATFTTQYYLTAAASPSSEGSINPASEWVNAGTVVPVSATATSGNQFTGFSGALTGTANPQNLTMNGPASVTANFGVASGLGWYNTSWSDRKPVTISHTQVATTLTNFPVLVSIPSDASLSGTAQTSGNDILFTASDGVTKLNHEIETYTSSTGQLLAWVQVPSLSSTTDTVLYMYYGNGSATNQQNRTGVWDANFAAVLHLANGTTLSGADSTGNAANGVLGSGVTATSGEIDGAASFNGQGGIDLKNAVFSNPFSALTVELWTKYTATGQQFLNSGNAHFNMYAYSFAMGAGIETSGTGPFVYLGTSVSNGAWHHVAVTYDSATGAEYAYVDGVSAGSAAGSGTVSLGSEMSLGAWAGNNPPYFNGNMDEVRISNIARTSGWIATEYNNESSPSTFLSVGAQQSNGSSTVSITVTSAPVGLAVTVDEASCPVTPCTYQWTPGSMHTLAAATQAGSAGTQYAFASWTGSAGSPDQVTAPSTPATYTATFTTQYYLTAAASPSSEGSINPASEWVNAGTVVPVSATATSGNQFTGFSGALTGTANPQNLTMNGPASVTANFGVASGLGWYNTSWSDRKPVTISHTQVATTLTNFPVLVSIPSDASLSGTAQTSGNDILFTASDGVTKLNHEIETYTSSTGQLLAWVQVPSLSSTTDTVLYMYYGNGSATNQQNRTGVWDANFAAVLHLANGTTLSGADSTGNAANGVLGSGVTATSGEIDGAASFNGQGGIDLKNAVFSNPFSALTVELWTKYTATGQQFLNSGNAHFNMYAYSFAMGAGIETSGTGPFVYLGTSVSNGAWHHVAVTYDSATGAEYAYVDGVSAGSAAGSGTVSLGSEMSLGAWAGNNPPYFNGNMDEVRISNIARTSGWIATEYNNESSPSTFLSVGAQQSNGSSTVSITVTSAPVGLAVTVDEASCPVTPCTYQWTPGSMHTLAAATQAGSAGTQYAFASWTGSAGSPDQVTAPSTPATYTATFTTQYYLTAAASPSSEGSINPASEWVNAGTVVPVSATATSGNQFTGFSGALTGTANPQNLTMNGPASVTANFGVYVSGLLNPAVNPSLFNVTTFASNVAYPEGMILLPDGSIAVETSPGYDSLPGQLLRFVDVNGVASGSPTLLYTSVNPGIMIQIVQIGKYYAIGNFGDDTVTLLQPGAAPTDPWTSAAVIQFTFAAGWDHSNAGLGARPTPGQPGSYDLVMNVGSEFDNTASVDLVGFSGTGFSSFPAGMIPADSLYVMTINGSGTQPSASNLIRVATGTRNSFGMKFQPGTGDFYFEDNAMDFPEDANGFPPQADELNFISAASFGNGSSPNFGFPSCYIQYITGTPIGSGCTQPLVAFQPIPDTVTGGRTQGPTEIAFSPAGFPAPYNNGIFIAFTGDGGLGDTTAGLVFYDFNTQQYFQFIQSGNPVIADLLGVLAASDALYVSDAGTGIIYKIAAASN